MMQTYRRLRTTLCCLVAVIALAGCSTDETSPNAEAVEPDSSMDDTHHPEDDVRNEQDDVSSSEDDGGSGGGGVTGLHPRWVLYDGDGDAVEAVVNAPTIWLEQHPAYQPVGTVIDPEAIVQDCVSVRAIGNDILPMHVPFHLPSGSVAPCAHNYTTLVKYLDAQCNGARYLNPSSFFILRIGQDAVWPQGEIIEPDTVYQLVDGTCEERSNSVKLAPLEPVPSSITDALPNPPYTVNAGY